MLNERTERRFKNVVNSKTFSNICNSYDLRNKAVLDIGCSYGEFLIHFGKGSVGLTVTEDEVEYGRDQKNLDIRLCNIETDNFSTEQEFDVIFANNIFEHLYSPHNFLINCKKFLKVDGVLILGVPCIPKIASLTSFPKFRGSLAVEHINFFTRDTLMKTVERGGWIIEEARGFHMMNPTLDGFLNPVYPHFYIVAKINKNFAYPDRRMKELRGYKEIFSKLSK